MRYRAGVENTKHIVEDEMSAAKVIPGMLMFLFMKSWDVVLLNEADELSLKEYVEKVKEVLFQHHFKSSGKQIREI
jgi:hypothetical protein